MKNKFWLPFLLSATIVFGIIIGWLSRGFTHASHSDGKLYDVLTLIHDNYVEEIDMDSLVEMTIPLLLNNLDPHSSYIPAKDYENANNELEGKFSGIGISFQIFNDTLTVVEVISGGPSERKGILPGDRIIKVDDKVVAGNGITNQDVFNMLRGPKGTKVKVTVKRANSPKPIDFEITRDDIPVESVDAAYMIDSDTGYIKVSRFARDTYKEFLQALNKLRLQGAKDYVIDLRQNGGGYMETAIMMVNEFLPAGQTIVSTKGRDKENDQYVVSDGSGSFQDFGVTVIIDEFSASASEIFSGAIQDNDRGWVVGRRSFGKGLVQRPVLLPDSSEVRLTVQRYYTPSGRCIQKEYKPGANNDYDMEIINRFNNGEVTSADSVKLNLDQKFTTASGRTVYGGGGIMPDYFVAEDTTGITSYYIAVTNAGLLQKYSYTYADDNRQLLNKAKTVDQLLKLLPPDEMLLRDFVDFAVTNGIPARWYYINISTPLIVNHLKALIARDILGIAAYHEVINSSDPTLSKALEYSGKPVTK